MNNTKNKNFVFIFYFLYSFSFSPRGRFVFQTEISGKYIVLVLISRLFYFLSSLRRGDQSTVFCKVTYYNAGQNQGFDLKVRS